MVVVGTCGAVVEQSSASREIAQQSLLVFVELLERKHHGVGEGQSFAVSVPEHCS